MNHEHSLPVRNLVLKQILHGYVDGADVLVISVRDQPVLVRRSMIGIDLWIECKMFYISESFDKMFAAGLMSNRVSKRQQGNKRWVFNINS